MSSTSSNAKPLPDAVGIGGGIIYGSPVQHQSPHQMTGSIGGIPVSGNTDASMLDHQSAGGDQQMAMYESDDAKNGGIMGVYMYV
jgi:hypothetical protein